MSDGLMLVAGATGALGQVVVKRMLGDGFRVRALSRDSARLVELARAGAEPMVADMLDHAAMDRACAGVTDIVSTANNILGKGARSPNRIDEAMYRTLGSAARDAGVRRWVHVSARDLTADSPVDFFRVKVRVEQIVRESGVPWVAIRPSAFMISGRGCCSGMPSGRERSRPSSGAATSPATSSPWKTLRRSSSPSCMTRR